MDSQTPDIPVGDNADAMEDDEEFEVTREELIAALQQVVTNLSTGLKGEERDSYLGADDLAQNDWFFAGVSDEDGQYAVTMWPAEGEEDMLRIDVGTEDDVHALSQSPDQVAALTDDFIEAMSEDFEDDYEEYEDEEDDEDGDDEDDDYEEDEEVLAEDDIDEDDGTVSQNGNTPPR
ncbi:MAG: hypothetical protein ABI670_15590 [Chloroflexota bacterium]